MRPPKATKLEEVRRAHGLSYSRLSQMSGLGLGHLHRLCLGYHYPRYSTAVKLATLFKMPVEELFPRSEYPYLPKARYNWVTRYNVLLSGKIDIMIHEALYLMNHWYEALKKTMPDITRNEAHCIQKKFYEGYTQFKEEEARKKFKEEI